MDCSIFDCESDFDEIEWINSVFKDIQKNEKEKVVEDALLKLEEVLKATDLVIEKSSSSNIKAKMPNIASETNKLKKQALNTKIKMEKLEKDIAKTENLFSMAHLERLDNIKTRLEAAKDFLEQNDTFSRLEEELEIILENQEDISVACEKIECLSKSFEAQKGLAGDMERKITLEDFKNRIEAEIAGSLIKVLSEGNTDESLKFVEMFRKIDRVAQMKSYYGTLQVENFMRSWIEVSGAVENSDNPRFLNDFYESILNSWSKQIRWHREVFKSDGVNETVQVICDTLSSLSPSRESIISSYLKRVNGTEKMELLNEISQANHHFAKAINAKIKESNVNVALEKMTLLSNSIYNYFNIFIVHYSTLEQSLIDTNFDKIKIMQSNGGDTVRSLENIVPKVFEWMEKAIDRSSLITQDCALISIIYIFNTFLKTKFLDKIKKAQLQLDASRNDQQDWNLLQICISLLENIGAIKINLDSTEERIRNIILTKSKQISNNELFCYKMVGQRDIHDFNKFLNKISESKNAVIFESCMQMLEQIAKECHEMLLRNVFAPIEGYFSQFLDIKQINSTSSEDLPDFSLTPLNYITEIGQFLVTLPQHLEPLLLQPSKPLKVALDLSDESYRENVPSADVLLSIIANETCSVFMLKIRQITSLTSYQTKQLVVDIDYLGNVLEELGFTLSNYLKQTVHLLKAKPENYLSASAGFDHKLIAAIRQMRNININNDDT